MVLHLSLAPLRARFVSTNSQFHDLHHDSIAYEQLNIWTEVIKISFNPIIGESVIKRLSQQAMLHGTRAQLSESDINLTASCIYASHKSFKLISQGMICHT